MTDTYEGMGEFHDLFMVDTWQGLRPGLASAFADLDADAIVLDIGAGSGIGTRLLARSTSAQIIAIEPSLTMRAVLLARIADATDMVDRVSVLAGTAPEVLDEVSGPVAGFVCAHMLGHLTAVQRRETFTRLAGLLAPQGIGIITVPRLSDSDGTDMVQEAIRIGRHRYVERYWPASQKRESRSEYLVFDGERILRRHTFAASWEPPTLEQLRSDLGQAGLYVADTDGPLGVVRRSENVA